MAVLPYLTSPGNISKAFAAIQAAATPDKVSQDFVKTVLRIPGGSGDNMTTFLKRIGFASSDGTPTERYKRFRNQRTAGDAVADAMRDAYGELFRRNEFAHLLDEDELRGQIVEITGSATDARPVTLTLSTFKNLLEFANFTENLDKSEALEIPPMQSDSERADTGYQNPNYNSNPPSDSQKLGLNIGYTINLNLPATSDISVFNAIFKSLKEHLLKNDD